MAVLREDGGWPFFRPDGAWGTDRLIAALLFDDSPSIARITALAGVPVLMAAWALMSPPHLLSNAMTWDLLFNLAGAWHIHLGQQPHVDFHEPLGRLNFLLTAFGFRIVGPHPASFLVGVAIVTAVLFAGALLVAWRRLPLLPAAIFVVFVCLLALMPTNIGERPNLYSFAMSYNRYCWGALAVLAMILFVPPQERRGHDGTDLAIAALLLLALFYLKITYFTAAMAMAAAAIVLYPHLRQRWPSWAVVAALVTANAAAPFNQDYLHDLWEAARLGAAHSDLALQLNNIFAAASEHGAHAAALVLAGWFWLTRRAPWRVPIAVGLLFAIGLSVLSQNTQKEGLPLTVVMVMILYDLLRRLDARRSEVAPLLAALLVFPLFSIAASAYTLAGYSAKARRDEALFVVERTNLQGLAVPAGERGSLSAYARAFAYNPARDRAGVPLPHYEVSQYEYVVTLIEAADLVSLRSQKDDRTAPHIALLDQVNPLPFMLGLPPARGGNLWSIWNRPLPDPEQYLGSADYVLIPKFSTAPSWTAALVDHYRLYLEDHFSHVADTDAWVLLARGHQRGPRHLGNWPEDAFSRELTAPSSK